jgi:hypothetical protein
MNTSTTRGHATFTRVNGTDLKLFRVNAGVPVEDALEMVSLLQHHAKPKKVFAPLTWCERADGQTKQWRWQGLPDPRPLLRLDELAQRSDAPVVLCEGEKAADAAAELLSSHVATCWPNGSNSWHKSDLTPLKGRDVLLWPDNDDSGKACMEAVAEKLREIGAASVRFIALNSFKRKPALKNG